MSEIYFGIKCSFINENGFPESLEWQGGTWTDIKTWDTLEDENGVFIMFHRKTDNFPLMVKPSKWSSYQKSGEIAEGVVVADGDRMLVVSLTETKLAWSSAAVAGGGTTTIDRLTALADWNGKANTATQITHAECNTVDYAPGFCNAYSATNANNKGLTAGKWWLPSIGELMLMYTNCQKINFALSFIKDATPITDDLYLSSTENNKNCAWAVNFKYGYVYAWAEKVSSANKVRPVSAFIE